MNWKKIEKDNTKILMFCSRCGKKFCKLGKILEYGKHYQAFVVKQKSGEKKEFPAEDEIKSAVCQNCAKDLFDLSFFRLKFEEAMEEALPKEYKDGLPKGLGEYGNGYNACLREIKEKISKGRENK